MNKKKLLLATGVLSILNVNAFAVDVTTGNGSGIAYGTNSIANENNSIAVGQNAKATNISSVAIGLDAKAIGFNSIAIGMSTSSHPSVNYGPVIAKGTNSIAVGYGAQANHDETVVIGANTATISTKDQYGINTNPMYSTVIGYSSKSTNQAATVVGYNSTGGGWNSIVLGNFVDSTGRNSIGIGYGAKSSNENSIAIGKSSDASEYNSMAIGSYAIASKNLSVAIGNNATANNENSVALGSSSNTDETVVTTSARIGNKNYNFASSNVLGTVSVGGKIASDYEKEEDGSPKYDTNGQPIHIYDQITRTITNVAAGRINEKSTDAINGSQLHAVITEMESKNQNTLIQANHYTDIQVNKGVAKASALAGLKYLDYNPKDKWSFAASIGHYRNANAVAVGAAYQPNENTMIHGGITVDGKVAYNLGVSVKVGGQKYINKYELAEQIRQLQSDNAELRQELNELRSLIGK